MQGFMDLLTTRGRRVALLVMRGTEDGFLYSRSLSHEYWKGWRSMG